MTTNTKLWYLEQFDLSKKLSKKEMMHLAEMLTMKSYKRGEYIVFSEEHHGKIFMLKTGMVKVVSIQESGEEHIKYIIKAGGLFGELSLTEEKSTDAIIAIEHSLVCFMEADQMKMLMQKYSSLNNYIYKIMGLRIRKIESRLEAIIHKDSQTRVKDFIFDFVKGYGKKKGKEIIVKNVLSNRDIGKLTYTSRQTVNTVLNNLRNQNLIQYDNRYIRILEDNLVA